MGPAAGCASKRDDEGTVEAESELDEEEPVVCNLG
jgi:hypothetical protein